MLENDATICQLATKNLTKIAIISIFLMVIIIPAYCEEIVEPELVFTGGQITHTAIAADDQGTPYIFSQGRLFWKGSQGWVQNTISPTPTMNTFPTMLIDKEGHVHIFYHRFNNNNNYSLFHAVCDSKSIDGTVWVAEELLTKPLDYYSLPYENLYSQTGWASRNDAVEDVDGTIHVIYGYAQGDKGVLYTQKNESGWSVPERITTGNNVVADLALTLGPDGKTLHVAYIADPEYQGSAYPNYLHYARKAPGQNWEISPILFDSTMSNVEIVMKGETPVILYTLYDSSTAKYDIWIAERGADGIWNKEILYQDIEGSNLNTLEAVLIGDELHVVYSSNSNLDPRTTYFIKSFIDGSVTTTKIGSTYPDYGTYPSIATDHIRIHIASQFNVNTLQYVRLGDGNYPPFFYQIEDKTILEGDNLEFSVTAIDNDNDPLGYSAVNLPSGASFNSENHQFSWIPDKSQSGTYTITFIVFDGVNSVSINVNINVIDSNNPPVIEFIGDKQINEGELLTFLVSATDSDEDILTYSAESLPYGAIFNPITQEFLWSPSFIQSGIYSINFKVTDGIVSSIEKISILVNNIPINLPQTIEPELVFTGGQITHTAIAADDQGTPYIFSQGRLFWKGSQGWVQNTISPTPTMNTFPTMLIDKEGHVHIFYHRFNNNNNYSLFHAVCDSKSIDGTVWVAEELLTKPLDYYSLPYENLYSQTGWASRNDAVEDVDGTIHVIYGYAQGDKGVLYTQKNESGWSVPERITTGNNVVADLALTLGPDGKTLHVAYIADPEYQGSAYPNYLHYARKAPGQNWEISPILFDSTMSNVEIVMKGETPVILYTLYDSSTAKYDIWIAERGADGIWNKEILYQDIEGSNLNTLEAVLIGDELHVVYSSNSNLDPRTTYFIKSFIDGSVTTTKIGSTYPDYGTYPSIATDHIRIHIASQFNVNTLQYVRLGDGNYPQDTNQAPEVPVLSGDAADGTVTVDEGEPVTFSVSSTDPDVGDTVTVTASGLPEGATFDGTTFSWTPTNAQAGTYTITFTASDGTTSASSSVTITVENVNQAPEVPVLSGDAADGTVTVDEGEPVTFSVSSTDPDVGDTVTVTASGLPEGATFDGTTFSWTPTNAQAGTYTITFTASDGTTSASSSVTITVENVNQAPEVPVLSGDAADGTVTVDEGEPVTFSVSSTDPDVGDTVTVTASGLPEGATFDGTTFSWTPTNAQAGTYTITFTASDGTTSASSSVTITVENVNQAPEVPVLSGDAADGTVTVDEGEPVTFSVSSTDPDVGDTVTVTASGLPEGATFDGTTFSWTPTNAQAGTYTITFTASDGTTSASSSVTITVENVNQAPEVPVLSGDAADGTVTVDEGEPVTFSVSSTDPDVGDTVTVTASGLPEGATFDGTTFSWTPTNAQAGTYTITFTASDGTTSASSSVTITVENVNQAPEVPVLSGDAADGTVTVDEGEPVTFSVSSTDPDVGDTVTVTASGLPEGATFDGTTFSWTPTNAQAGTYTITFTASDGTTSASSSVTITVENVNQAPEVPVLSGDAADGTVTVDEGEPVTFSVSSTDPDVGDTVTVTASGLPEGATFDGTTFSWTPTNAQAGTYTITFTASDGTTSASSSVTITVENVNQAPEVPVLSGDAADGTVTVDEGEPVTFSVSSTDPDVGDTVTVTASGLPEGATFDGTTFSWTPDNNNSGEYLIVFIATDGSGAMSNITVTITVIDTIQPPSDSSPPLISDIFATPNPAPINTPIVMTATIDDSLNGGSKIASVKYSSDGISWLPMNPADGAFDEMTEVSTITLPGKASAEVLSITLRAMDSAGNTALSEPLLIAIYDPNGAFVTAGGWILSPVGAYKPDVTATGKANIGLNCKYKKGTTVPTGETEFHLKEGDLKFKATSYEWLVITGPKAIYRGSGTINGNGNYGFQIVAVDGELSGADDTFRIQIWEKATNTLVYDNGAGSTTGDPVTPLGGGNIKIHK